MAAGVATAVGPGHTSPSCSPNCSEGEGDDGYWSDRSSRSSDVELDLVQQRKPTGDDSHANDEEAIRAPVLLVTLSDQSFGGKLTERIVRRNQAWCTDMEIGPLTPGSSINVCLADGSLLVIPFASIQSPIGGQRWIKVVDVYRQWQVLVEWKVVMTLGLQRKEMLGVILPLLYLCLAAVAATDNRDDKTKPSNFRFSPGHLASLLAIVLVGQVVLKHFSRWQRRRRSWVISLRQVRWPTGDVVTDDAPPPSVPSESVSAPHKVKRRKFIREEDWGLWTEPDAQLVMVRGPDYRSTRMLVPATCYFFDLVHCDLFAVDYKLRHVAAGNSSYIHTRAALARKANTTHKWPMVVVNMFYKVAAGSYNSVVCYLERSPRIDQLTGVEARNVQGLDRMFHRFVKGSEEFRPHQIRILPHVPDGSWIVAKTVKTALLRKRMDKTFFTDATRSYIEVDIDISSSRVAARLVSLVGRHSKNLILDLNFGFRGPNPKECPEILLGGVRLVKVDIKKVPGLAFRSGIEPATGQLALAKPGEPCGIRKDVWGIWTEAVYTNAHRKLKSTPSAGGEASPTFFRLAHCEVVHTPYKPYHLASRKASYAQSTYIPYVLHSRRKARMEQTQVDAPASCPLLVITIQYPAGKKGQIKGQAKGGDPHHSIVLYFVRQHSPKENDRQTAVFDRIYDRFLDESDAVRNQHFKILVNLPDSKWALQTLVQRGALRRLGSKLTKKYFQDIGRHYLEIDIDLGTTPRKMLSLARKKAEGQSPLFDLFFAFQGFGPSELDNCVLGGVRMNDVDLTKVPKLNDPAIFVPPSSSPSSVPPSSSPTAASSSSPPASSVSSSSHSSKRSKVRSRALSSSGAPPRGHYNNASSSSSASAAPPASSSASSSPSSDPPTPSPQKINTASWGKWTESDSSVIKVRGSSYLSDRTKQDAGGFLFRLVHSEMFATAEKLYHVATTPGNFARVHLSKQGDVAKERFDLDTLIIVNFMFPGIGGLNSNLVVYFSVDPSFQSGTPEHAPFERLLDRFLNGTDEFRTSRFKIIPRIAEGHWVVKKTVGTTPAILGNKLTQTYCHDETNSYLEIDVDVGSSKVGGGILSMVKGQAASLEIEISFLLEGQTEDELPERLLGGLRLIHVDMSKLPKLGSVSRRNSFG